MSDTVFLTLIAIAFLTYSIVMGYASYWCKINGYADKK